MVVVGDTQRTSLALNNDNSSQNQACAASDMRAACLICVSDVTTREIGMTDSIDRALQRLGQAELPAASDDLQRGVMARIDARINAREARPSLGVGFGAAALAMSIGLASVSVAPAPEKAPLELSIFSAKAVFAPATLLATEG